MNTVTQIEYEFQGGYIRASVKKDTPPEEIVRARRGQVFSFSPASRRRLMTMLNRLDWSAGSVAFCSLTYGQLFPDVETFKRHIDIFGKRMMRWAARHGCSMSFIWKMEFQKRGAPHLHLLVFGLPSSMTEFELRQLMRWTWALSIGGDYWDKSDSDYWRVPFVQADWMTTKKRAMSYVSKYLAKVDVDQSVAAAHDFEEQAATDGAKAHDGFNNVSYLTAASKTGRVWGVIGRENLPFAEIIRVVVDAVKRGLGSFYGMRRLAAAKLKSQWRSRPISKRRRKPHTVVHGRFVGFSLFVDDALQWFGFLSAVGASA